MSVTGTWLWFDEFERGSRYELGSHTFTRDDVVRFAAKYDPQPFHLDEEAGAASVFGALAASGWHTAAAFMRCCAEHNFIGRDAAVAEGKDLPPLGVSPGFENLKWHRPVYPGDTVAYFNEVTGKRELNSRRDWGLVMAHNTGFNQNGELVFSFDGKLFVARR